MARRPPAAALLALAALLSVSFADETEKTTEWKTLAPGLWHRPWAISRSTDDALVTGHAFRADPRIVHVTVVDARRGERKTARVAELREESRAYLVVNGGFFDEHTRPLGLAVGSGRTLSPLRKVDQGVFLIAQGKASIQHAKEPLPENVETAIQAGPRLVVDGRALQLKPQISRRSAVCVPGDGTVSIVVFPTAISLSDLAANLVRPTTEGGLGCWSALNLDGGPSTQLAVRTPGFDLDVQGGWGVPNALAIVPR